MSTVPSAMNAQTNNRSDRVAVVVVHGIADQRPGQTVRELARLLCHGGEGEPRYVEGELREVLVPVQKLEPGSAADAASELPPLQGKGRGGDGVNVKIPEPARRSPGTPSGFYQAQQHASPRSTQASAAPAQEKGASAAPDLGLA